MIIKHTCSHKGQDKLHGKGMRVFNKTEKSKRNDVDVYRCTVCLAEIEVKK